MGSKIEELEARIARLRSGLVRATRWNDSLIDDLVECGYITIEDVWDD